MKKATAIFWAVVFLTAVFGVVYLGVRFWGQKQESQQAEILDFSKEETVSNVMEGGGEMTELQIEDLVVGEGEEAVAGKKVTVNYNGLLTDGTKFDSSYDRGTPFSFNLGAGDVIKGWDMGVAGMKVGGKRKLVIPAILGYGDRGAGADIPPGATLVFEVELLEVE